MQMDIQSQGFSLTDGLRDYVMKRLAYGLNHGDETITRVIVRLSDINGPRGGEDKRCLIEVRLKTAPAVVIEDTEADLYVAIDRAAERAGRTLARRLARQREFVPAMPAEPVDADWAGEVGAQPGAPHP
ncbi:MAG: HPF/RaiA family ribosome-associated protein [Pseudomonadota bacterium]|nr:HPF/RaiA family ribosome-associated protein [Pseudomonadota bacterium]